jgi:hypothetical protein
MMEASLAAMLSTYPLFAGRLRTSSSTSSSKNQNGSGGRYQVELCNKGSLLSIATCDLLLKHLLPAEFLSPPNNRPESFLYSAPDFSPFLPAIPSSILGYCNHDNVPLFHAQITQLHGGGTVLAVVVPHLIADQETCRLALKCWAEEYTAACIVAQVELNINGPIRMLSALFEEENAPKHQELSTSSEISSTWSTEEESCSSFAQSSGRISEENVNTATHLYSGYALEAHAAPALPQNWTSQRFEKRSWSFFASIACSFLWHVGSLNNLSTVTYYVSSTRLSDLKSEANVELNKSLKMQPAWLSHNDCLAARIRQVIAKLPGKSTKMQLWVNLRKRMVPQLPQPLLGNCSWTVSIPPAGQSQSSSTSLNLGSLAAEVRAAIQTVNNQEYISQELRWLEDAFSISSTSSSANSNLPCVFKNATDILKPNGPLMLSHWDWGGSSYSDVQFGPSNTPIWHQPPIPKVPNCVFVVPAAEAVEVPHSERKSNSNGVLVHATLHKRLAEELKRICSSL